MEVNVFLSENPHFISFLVMSHQVTKGWPVMAVRYLTQKPPDLTTGNLIFYLISIVTKLADLI